MKFKVFWNTLLVLILLIIIEDATADRILFFIGLGSRSHRAAMQPLASKLADLGHEVTFFAAVNPETHDPRILQVNLSRPYETVVKQNEKLGENAVAWGLQHKNYDYLMMGNVWADVIINQAKAFFEDKEFVNFVSTSKFDIVVGDFPSKEMAAAVAYKMKSKLIWFNTGAALFMWDADMLGVPIESSWLPDFTLGSTWLPDRIYYSINSISWMLSAYWYFFPNLNQIIAQSLGEGIPPVEELLENVELVLLNERFPYTYPRSLPPNVVPIGGMHIRHAKGILPKAVHDFIGDAEQFIFISFGSIINVNKLPTDVRSDLFRAVASFQTVRFLWKWDGDAPEDLPSNVLPMEWFPQQELLAHPKCKGFVTQGGAMSFQQGIHYAVPMVVIPVWWDQASMARAAAVHGVGIHLELSEITFDSFRSALHEILYNPSYSSNAKIVSQRSQDQPMASADLGAWWIEYVLRHDTAHFRSPGMKQSWWERRLLDVWFLLYSMLLLIIVIIYKVVKSLCYYCCLTKFETEHRGIKSKMS